MISLVDGSGVMIQAAQGGGKTRVQARCRLCDGSSRNHSAKNGHSSDRNCAAPLKLRNLPCTQVCSVATKYGLAGVVLTISRLKLSASAATRRCAACGANASPASMIDRKS